MLYEFAGGFFLAICVLWGMGEYTKKYIFCIIAAAMLFPLGAWTVGENFQIKRGELVISQDQSWGNSTVDGNVTTHEEFYNKEAVVDYVFYDAPHTPYIHFNNVVGILCFLIGTFGLFHYGLSFLENKAE